MAPIHLLTIPSLIVCITGACLQLAAGLIDLPWPWWYRPQVAIICIIFVMIFQYLAQREQKTWLSQSRMYRWWSIFLSGSFAQFTQVVCWAPDFELWFRIMILALPLGTVVAVHIRERRKAGMGSPDEIVDEKHAQVDA